MISLWFLYVSACLVWFEALDHHGEQELVVYLHGNPGPHLEDLRENAPCITQSSTQELWAKLTRVIWNHWGQPCLIMFVYVCYLRSNQTPKMATMFGYVWPCVAYGSCSQDCERPYGKIGRRTKPKPVQIKQNACNHPEHPRAPINEENTFMKCYEHLWTKLRTHLWTKFSILPHLVSEQICCQTWWVQVEMNNHKKTQITTHVGTNMNNQ